MLTVSAPELVPSLVTFNLLPALHYYSGKQFRGSGAKEAGRMMMMMMITFGARIGIANANTVDLVAYRESVTY